MKKRSVRNSRTVKKFRKSFMSIAELRGLVDGVRSAVAGGPLQTVPVPLKKFVEDAAILMSLRMVDEQARRLGVMIEVDPGAMGLFIGEKEGPKDGQSQN